MLLDEDKSHVPNVEEQDGLVGLLLFCIILELSNALHPGTYESSKGDQMTELERYILVDARKHARLLISWVKASLVIQESDSLQDIDLSEILLWRVTMTLSSAIEDNREEITPFLPGCTPDAVACAIYDTLLGRKGSDYWEGRKEFIDDSYDWEGILVITQRDKAFPLEDGITGMTEADRCHKEKQPPPSANEGITMPFWLQRQDKLEKGE